ncbi:UDP-glycosyltransferase [Trifolium repens]|nr:UDP-glycosyltransferase [Trifolium repens]
MSDDESVHVAMFPCAGMGHLTPFLRLASLLLTHHCKVTLINPLPIISHAESQLLSHFHSSFPQLNLIPFHLPPFPPIPGDPFILRVQTLPSMFSFVSHFPTLAQSNFDTVIPVPGIPFSPLPYSSIPPILFHPTVFRNLIMEDSPNLTKLHGVFLNTFEALESHSLKALNDGKVVKDMPPVYAVGPFVPFKTALGRDQMREIGNGLMKSGYNFLWVVKDKIVDKEDEEIGLDEVLGVELVDRMKKKGLVIKEWVDQSEILSHKSVGGFVTHCGWNSIAEAALNGVPILAWPQHGDQKINAGLVEVTGWGIWKKSWGWSGERVVKGNEIGDAIKVIMENELLKVKALELKEGGRKAISVGGDCEVTIQKLIQKWKNGVNNV